MVNGLKHFAHLSLFALVDDHLHLGVVPALCQQPDDGRSGPLTVDLHPPLQASQFLCCRCTDDQGLVGFVHLVAGMQNEIAQFTVVGHEQGAFRIEIESTDGKKTLRKVGHKIGNRRPALRVGEGGHIPGRFVEQDIDFLLEPDRLAVTGDDILSRVDFQTHRLHDVAVDGNPTGANQFLGTSAGSDTGLGKDFLQSFTHSVRRADGIPSTVVSEREDRG